MDRHLAPDFLPWLSGRLKPKNGAALGRAGKRDRYRFAEVLLPLDDRRLLSMFVVTSEVRKTCFADAPAVQYGESDLGRRGCALALAHAPSVAPGAI
jgi:hypothetical protein